MRVLEVPYRVLNCNACSRDAIAVRLLILQTITTGIKPYNHIELTSNNSPRYHHGGQHIQGCPRDVPGESLTMGTTQTNTH